MRKGKFNIHQQQWLCNEYAIKTNCIEPESITKTRHRQKDQNPLPESITAI